MGDLAVYGLAGFLTAVAVLTIVVAVWATGAEAWRERREKQRRGGYIELSPTPGRDRLGLSANRSRRGRRRPGP